MVLIMSLMMLAACDGEEPHDPLGTVYEYMDAYETMDFERMYTLLDEESRSQMTKEDYLAIYKGLYESLPISEARMESRMEVIDMERKIIGETSVRIPMNIIMLRGEEEIRYSADVKIVKEKVEGVENFKVAFSPELIYQGFERTDRIETREAKPERGRIFDRNMKPLAINDEVLWIGMVPGQLGPGRNQAITALAESFGFTEKYITGRLGLSWVQDNMFVDMFKATKEDRAKIDALVAAYPGITYRVVKDRVYPYREAAAHLTGYLGLVNREEYEVMKPLGFPMDARIGRSGLELLYEEELRGQMGTEKILVNKDGDIKEVLSTDHNNRGKDIILTIDIEKQVELYELMSGETGTASVVNYLTGEIEALVSAPSYDPNTFILGHSQASYSALANDPKNPLLNRFTKLYIPGSTIKPLTAAIALESGSFDENKVMQISGTKWQLDSSWGNYSVTRVTDPLVPVDLSKAFIYSDNIYFAQMALEIGKDTFLQGMNTFGVGQDDQLGFGFETSQVANGGVISSNILLADSGYGQGQVLFNALTLPKAYTAFSGGGVMKGLKLFMDAQPTAETSVISSKTADRILGLMKESIDDPEGTGHGAYIEGRMLSGKTGTSEVGQGRNRIELGWFSVIDEETSNPYITTMMIENVQGRGGSEVAVGKVKEFITDYGLE